MLVRDEMWGMTWYKDNLYSYETMKSRRLIYGDLLSVKSANLENPGGGGRETLHIQRKKEATIDCNSPTGSPSPFIQSPDQS